MNKKLKIGLTLGIIFVGIILVLLEMNNFGKFYSLNRYFNKNPDKTCAVDSDCVLKRTTCSYCDCGDAVNKYWNSFCPFKKIPMGVMCKMCPSLNRDFEVKCVENQCQRAWKNK